MSFGCASCVIPRSRDAESVVAKHVDVFTILFDVQTALENLGGQMAEQHRELAAQLRGHLAEQRQELNAHRGAMSQRGLSRRPYNSTGDAVIPERERVTPELPQCRHLSTEAPLQSMKPALVQSGTFSAMTNHMSVAMGSCSLDLSAPGQEGTEVRRALERTSVLSWRLATKDLAQGRTREAVMRILYWDGFDRVIGVIIFLNALVIGVEVEHHDRERTGTLLQVAEITFLIIYTLELWMRLYSDCRSALRSGWIIFDLILIFVGVASQIVARAISMAGSLTMLQQLDLLRMMRLLRLLRAVRMIKQFKTLWRLVNGLITSYDAIFSTLVLILLVLYVASCAGVELICHSDKLMSAMAHDPNVAEAMHPFRSLSTAMVALVRFVTADNLSSVYEPIIEVEPLFVFYFMPLLMIITISLLNLITAVIVEGALEKAKRDKETLAVNLRRKVKQYLPLSRQLFQCIDTSGDGVLTLSELRSCLTGDSGGAKALQRQLEQVVPFENVLELFEILDTNGDGYVSEEEFVQGVLKTVLGDQDNLEITQILKLIRVIVRKVQVLEVAAVPAYHCFTTI